MRLQHLITNKETLDAPSNSLKNHCAIRMQSSEQNLYADLVRVNSQGTTLFLGSHGGGDDIVTLCVRVIAGFLPRRASL